MTAFGRFILSLIVIVILGIPVSLLSGVVLVDLWRWFVEPVFPAAPSLTYLQAIGLGLVAGWFKIGLQTVDFDTKNRGPIAAGIGVLVAFTVALLILWGAGAAWHHFI